MSAFNRRSIPGLDIIRFCAAMLVVIYHLGVATWAAKESMTARIVNGAVSYPELLSIGWFGFVGVEVFFMVSGFVIVYSAIESTPLRFLRSRILRLYPAAWICATISLAALMFCTAASIPDMMRDYLHSITLLPVGPWIDSVYWTLGIEMAFYGLIFCLLAVRLHAVIEVACYTVGGLSSLYWIAGSLAAPTFLERHLWSRTLELSLISYGCYFGLGALLYFASRQGFSKFRAALGVTFVTASMIEIGYKASFNLVIFRADELRAVPVGVFLVSVAALALSLAWNASEVINQKLRVVGMATYPLYLVHDNLGAVLLRTELGAGFNRYAALGGAVAACVVVSFAVSAVVEPRVRRALARVIDHALPDASERFNEGMAKVTGRGASTTARHDET